MISEHDFHHEGAYDFTNDSTASLEQDYITLFIYLKGHEYDSITVGKCAAKAKAIVKLFPYNFTKKTYRTYLTANGKKYYAQAGVLSSLPWPTCARVVCDMTHWQLGHVERAQGGGR
jgi:hypothetical protein